MKILVYGSKGWIGGQFMTLQTNCEVVEGQARLDNLPNVKKELEDAAPTHVFCFIAHLLQVSVDRALSKYGPV